MTRPADYDLLASIRTGEFCYVLTSRQMGKSSLMVRTARSLASEQIKSVISDLISKCTSSARSCARACDDHSTLVEDDGYSSSVLRQKDGSNICLIHSCLIGFSTTIQYDPDLSAPNSHRSSSISSVTAVSA